MQLPEPAKHRLDLTRLRLAFRLGAGRYELLRLALFGLALTAVLGTIMTIHFERTPRLVEGQVATSTVKAPRTFTFVSEVLTEAARREAAQDPSTIQLRLEPAVAEEQLRRLNEQLALISRIREDPALTISQRLTALRDLPSVKLTEPQINDLLNLADGDWAQVVAESRGVLGRALERQVISDEVSALRDRLRDWVRPGLSDVQRNLVVSLAAPFVRPNVVVDTGATERNRQRARAAVEPVRLTVQGGEVIIRDGSVITALDIEKADQAGVRERTPTLPEVLGTYLLVGLLVTVLLTYVVLFQPALWRGSAVPIVGIILAGFVAAARLFFPLHPLLPYAFPVAAAAMLLAVLYDAQLAIIAGALLALLLGIVAENSLELTVLYIVSGIASACIMWRADRTARFLTAGLAVSLAHLGVAMGFGLLGQNLDFDRTLQVTGLSLLSGALASGLTFVAFSLLGGLFGITTVLQLLELAHPNQPLLRRLAREAPGTYHHSIVVSSLAENAAELVGGDPLFTRVAVYYHDIGKMLRPYFFVENQVQGENPHDSLDPKTSAAVIIGHVSDGVALAGRYRLPRRIVDVIQEHHGTTQVRYFHQKALDLGLPVDEHEFTYPGPRPRTKESAIIMLADAVEATARSQAQAGKLHAPEADALGDDVGIHVGPADKIAEIVTHIISERLADGQLDECNLTLRDIGQIRAAFIAVLSNIYHPRIEYPAARRPAEAPRQPAVR